jgi:uncharacterized membrane protein
MSVKSLWLGLTAFLSISMASNVFAQQPCDCVRWGINLCMIAGWRMGWFSMVLMLVFWVLVIVGLVTLTIRQVQATKSKKDGRV